MKDEQKTKKQLASEMIKLRRRIAELEASESKHRQAEDVLRETTDYLDNLFNYANAPIIVWNPDTGITRFNHAFEHLTGYKVDEVIGKKLQMLFPESSREESLKKIANTLSGEYWESVEIPILRKDGDVRIALWNSANIHAGDGITVIATIAQGQDITERKYADKDLKESMERLSLALEASNSGMWEFNPHTFKNTHYNERWFTMLEYETGELPQTFETWEKLMHPDDLKPSKKRLQDHIEKKKPYSVEFRMKKKDGGYLWIYSVGKIVSWDKKGNPERMMGLHIDIDDRKHTEESLLKRNQELLFINRLTSHIGTSLSIDNIVKYALDGIVEIVHPDMAIIFKRHDDELIMQEVSAKDSELHDIEMPLHKVGECLCGLAVSEGKPIYSGNIHSDLRCTWNECKKAGFHSFAAFPLCTGDNIIIGVLGLASVKERDFAQKVEFLETLTNEVAMGIQNILLYKQIIKNREMLKAIFDGISDPLIMLDRDMSVKVLNKAALKYYRASDFEKVVGKPCFEGLQGKITPCEGCEIPSAIQSRQEKTFERKGIVYPERYEYVAIYPLYEKDVGMEGAVINIRDITENKKIQEQLIRADRLSSLGQLSGGIAHEIRNPLAGINLFMDILSDEGKYKRTAKEIEIFDEIKGDINKIDGIIRRVLDFARPSARMTAKIDINILIREEIKLWSAKIRKTKTDLKLSLKNEISFVIGDHIELRQVINNLVMNAIEAMKTRGTLEINTAGGISPFYKDRRVVVITVKDTGHGIKPEHKESIFNPFFTTKAEGTGLGLSILYNIIERHGGAISCESEPGKGTTFTIELPAIGEEIK